MLSGDTHYWGDTNIQDSSYDVKTENEIDEKIL